MKASKDYISMWFDVRKELGISDAMSIGPMNKSSGDIRWNTFSHSKMDGIGGIATILRDQGYPCKNLPISTLRTHGAVPGLVCRPLPGKKKKKTTTDTTRYIKSTEQTNTMTQRQY